MDIHELERFEDWFATRYPNVQKTIDLHNDHESIVFRNNQAEAWQAAKAQSVPTKKQFNLDEFLSMEQKLQSKGGIIKADLDRFIAYAEMVLEKAKAHRSQNDH